MSQWQLTRAFTSFCAPHNLLLTAHNIDSSVATAQYHGSIPAVKTALCCFQTLVPLIVLFVFICQGMSEWSETVISIKLTCYCNERVLLFFSGPHEVGLKWPYSCQTRYIAASWLSETWVESCVPVGALWWGCISYILCLMFYNVQLQSRTLMEQGRLFYPLQSF